jgi:cyclophilin family peptidyl-prolyl cis-trans isomerase
MVRQLLAVLFVLAILVPAAARHGRRGHLRRHGHRKKIAWKDSEDVKNAKVKGKAEEEKGKKIEWDKSSDKFVRCTIDGKGEILIKMHNDWAPIGAKRFLELVEDNFFTDHPLYRAVKDFIIQFGVSGDPKQQEKWRNKGTLKDDVNKHIKFKTNYLSYAGGGPNTRDTSLFFGASENTGQLNWWGREPWETPFAEVN